MHILKDDPFQSCLSLLSFLLSFSVVVVAVVVDESRQQNRFLSAPILYFDFRKSEDPTAVERIPRLVAPYTTYMKTVTHNLDQFYS